MSTDENYVMKVTQYKHNFILKTALSYLERKLIIN